jgi:hypothetical protein
MHRTDGNAHVGNMFDAGDPLVPRLPTQVDKDWLNAIQEELVGVVLDAGIALVKGTNTQLLTALRGSFVRVTGAAAQTITGVKTFTSKLIAGSVAGGSGGGGLRGLFESDLAEGTGADATVAIRNYGAGLGLDTSGSSGVKGSATANGTQNAGCYGSGASASAYGVIMEGKTTSPTRSAGRIVPQSAAPTTAQMGDLYVDATTGKLLIYNGTAWVVVGTQT